MKAINKKLIVILGMHRGGTSVITRGLKVLGVDLGNAFLPPQKDNPKGFWEDVDINALNIEMLTFLNSDWHFLTPIQPDDVEVLCKNGYLLRAMELFRTKMTEAPIFGFKDPRTTKLLPFWKKVFEHGQFKTHYILAIRHPLSVCTSLAKRNGFEFEKGYLLWLEHVINSFEYTMGESRIVVDYDRLMRSPETELAQVANEFQLQIDDQELEKFKLEFLDNELRHTVYQLNDLTLDEAAPPLAQEVYAKALNVAADRSRMEDATFKNNIKQWSQELSRLKSILVFADKLESRIAAAQVQVAEKEQSVQALTAQVTEKEQTVQALSAQVAEKEQSVQALTAQVAEKEQAVQALTAQLAEKEQSVQALTGQVAEKEQSVQALTARVVEQEQSVQEFSAQALSARLNEIVNSKAWKIALLFRKIRILIAPPNSHRARILQGLFTLSFFPLRKTGQEQNIDRVLTLIKTSGLFDETWYLANNPDVGQAKIDPIRHYLLFGGFEGRDPGPNFVSKWYLNTYSDVSKAGINPLVHYLRYGQKEGRDKDPHVRYERTSNMSKKGMLLNLLKLFKKRNITKGIIYIRTYGIRL